MKLIMQVKTVSINFLFCPFEMEELKSYSSCDVSDALNSIGGVELVGQLTDINLMTGFNVKIVGPAYTAEFGWVSEEGEKPAINHVDTIPRNSILVIKSPPTAINAVFGGLYFRVY